MFDVGLLRHRYTTHYYNAQYVSHSLCCLLFDSLFLLIVVIDVYFTAHTLSQFRLLKISRPPANNPKSERARRGYSVTSAFPDPHAPDCPRTRAGPKRREPSRKTQVKSRRFKFIHGMNSQDRLKTDAIRMYKWGKTCGLYSHTFILFKQRNRAEIP